MGKPSKMKRKGGNVVTKKMITSRMDDMASLMTAMEATLMEWEIWYRLISQQKKYLNAEQYEMFINDGPIFTDFPGKIMESIRQQMPKMDEPVVEEQKPPAILDGSGLPAQIAQKTLLDSSGRQIN